MQTVVKYQITVGLPQLLIQTASLSVSQLSGQHVVTNAGTSYSVCSYFMHI